MTLAVATAPVITPERVTFFEDWVNLSVFYPPLDSPGALCELHRKRPDEKLVYMDGGGSHQEGKRAFSPPPPPQLWTDQT